LKKQSQFSKVKIGATSYVKGTYDNIKLRRAQKNKANSKFTPLSSSGQAYSCWVMRDTFCVWIPAFAGMTKRNISVYRCKSLSIRPFDYAQGMLFGKKACLKKQSQFAGGLN
jgi:hypothetical protein